jgi:hypothetical protein
VDDSTDNLGAARNKKRFPLPMPMRQDFASSRNSYAYLPLAIEADFLYNAGIMSRRASAAQDDAELAALGHKQELKRNFSKL